jgi:hypothetical protein
MLIIFFPGHPQLPVDNPHIFQGSHLLNQVENIHFYHLKLVFPQGWILALPIQKKIVFLSKRCMFYLPFFQGDAKPETVYAKSNNTKEKPFNPIAKQADGAAAEFKSPAFNNGMLDFPSIHHAQGPGIADSKSNYCN